MKLFKTRKWTIVSFSLVFLFMSYLSSWAVSLIIDNQTGGLNIQAKNIDVYQDSRSQSKEGSLLAPHQKETLSWSNAWLNWECSDQKWGTWYSKLKLEVSHIRNPGVRQVQGHWTIDVNLKNPKDIQGVGPARTIIEVTPLGEKKWWLDESPGSSNPFAPGCSYYEGFKITVSHPID